MALWAVVFVVLCSCVISFSTCGNKEEFEAFVMFEFQILKGSELLLVTELCSFIRKITSIFSDTYSFKNRPSACIRFRLISNLISNALFFSCNNIVFLAEAELNIFIFLPS